MPPAHAPAGAFAVAVQAFTERTSREYMLNNEARLFNY